VHTSAEDGINGSKVQVMGAKLARARAQVERVRQCLASEKGDAVVTVHSLEHAQYRLPVLGFTHKTISVSKLKNKFDA